MDSRRMPVERGFWFFMDDQRNIGEIGTVLKSIGIKWEFNQNYYDYYLYRRFFEDLFGYMELDILKKEGVEKIIEEIKNIYDWLIPKMEIN